MQRERCRECDDVGGLVCSRHKVLLPVSPTLECVDAARRVDILCGLFVGDMSDVSP